jgi:hypothetical protein
MGVGYDKREATGKEVVWRGENFRDSIINHKEVGGRAILNRT